MPNIDKHLPGGFSWIELGTTDQAAAKTFYTSLFGWSFNDAPMGPNEFYTIFQLQGRDVAAGYTLGPQTSGPGVPPHWMLYISVENADDAANRAAKAGGKVLKPAFDVFDAGRMAVVQDPTGATFCVWQAKRNQGIGLSGVDGTLCWADLMTRDAERAKKFYSDVFGWTLATAEHDPSGYIHIKNGEEFIGGIPTGHQSPNGPPHWQIYILVSDCDATAQKAKQLGAGILFGPETMENVGRMAGISDPQGAVFSIFQPKPRN